MPHIQAHSKLGMRVLPLIIRPCAWQIEEFLARRQIWPTDGRALSLESDSQVDLALALSDFTSELSRMVTKPPEAAVLAEGGSLSAPPVSKELLADPTGTWAGSYERDEICLVVLEKQANSFHGTMEYPKVRIMTIVKGLIHESYPSDDNRWTKINGEDPGTYRFAVSFTETGYHRRGQCEINLDGEYLAFATNDDMHGAWFSGNRLVGRFALRRTSSA